MLSVTEWSITLDGCNARDGPTVLSMINELGFPMNRRDFLLTVPVATLLGSCEKSPDASPAVERTDRALSRKAYAKLIDINFALPLEKVALSFDVRAALWKPTVTRRGYLRPELNPIGELVWKEHWAG